MLAKARVFSEHYRNEKFPATTPLLPVFSLALRADEFNLPPVDPAWEKVTGYEVRQTQFSDRPAFLAKKDLNPKQNGLSDLRRSQPMMDAPATVQSR